MAKRFGNDELIWINTSGTFGVISGQSSLSQSASRTTIDTSDKTTQGYDTEAGGNKKLQITFDCSPDLPDTTGFARLQAVWASGAEELFQIRTNGLDALVGDAVFEASMRVLNFSKSAGRNSVVTWSVTLGLAAAPTIDLV